jgi:hypothetical protein
MRKYFHEWQKPFDIVGFHFSSILQAEAVLLFLNYRGNVKLIASKMGNTNRIPIDAKLRRFRKDNNMDNNIHMVMRLVGRMGFWNELEGYLMLHRDLLAEAKQRAEQGRQALIKRRK